MHGLIAIAQTVQYVAHGGYVKTRVYGFCHLSGIRKHPSSPLYLARPQARIVPIAVTSHWLRLAKIDHDWTVAEPASLNCAIYKSDTEPEAAHDLGRRFE